MYCIVSVRSRLSTEFRRHGILDGFFYFRININTRYYVEFRIRDLEKIPRYFSWFREIFYGRDDFLLHETIFFSSTVPLLVFLSDSLIGIGAIRYYWKKTRQRRTEIQTYWDTSNRLRVGPRIFTEKAVMASNALISLKIHVQFCYNGLN